MVYPTVEDIIYEYLTFVMFAGDDLGIFLAQFRWFWERAYPFGVTDYDGIVRLIMLLPSDWQGWAIDRSRDYVFSVAPFFDIVGDFPQFLGEIHSCFILNGQAPRGPYILPGDLVPVRATVVPEPSYPEPGIVAPPLSPITFGHQERGEFEAGPSRPPMGEQGTSRVRTHPSPSPPGGDATDIEARELRAAAAERRKRGKAPVSSEEGEEQEIQVGTGHLQPLPTPLGLHAHASSLEKTYAPHAPGSSLETAIAIDESSEDEEDPEEDPEYEASISGSSTG